MARLVYVGRVEDCLANPLGQVTHPDKNLETEQPTESHAAAAQGSADSIADSMDFNGEWSVVSGQGPTDSMDFTASASEEQATDPGGSWMVAKGW